MGERLAKLRSTRWAALLFYTACGVLGAATFNRFVNWVVYEGGAFRFKLRKMRLEPHEERYLEPVFAGPEEGFYWPSKLDGSNLEQVLKRRLELSKERMQRARERANLPAYEIESFLQDGGEGSLELGGPTKNSTEDKRFARQGALLRVLQERTRQYVERRTTRR